MNNGFIKIYRQLQNWEWYTDSATVHFFIHCLFSANWKDKRWQGTEVKRGQFISSIQNLSGQTGLTPKQVRLRIKRLEDTGEIITERTNKFTMITVCKYDTYQSVDEEEGKQKASKGQAKGNQKTNKGQSKGKQRATTKERKEYKEGEEGEEYSLVADRNDRPIRELTREDFDYGSNKVDEKIDRLTFKTYEMISQNYPTTYVHMKNATISKWRDYIRLMKKEDGLSLKEIFDITQHATTDDFWRTTIHSTSGIRKNYAEIQKSMMKNKKGAFKVVEYNEMVAMIHSGNYKQADFEKVPKPGSRDEFNWKVKVK